MFFPTCELLAATVQAAVRLAAVILISPIMSPIMLVLVAGMFSKDLREYADALLRRLERMIKAIVRSPLSAA